MSTSQRTTTKAKKAETEDTLPGFWHMQYGQLQQSLNTLEKAIRARGISPKQALDKLRWRPDNIPPDFKLACMLAGHLVGDDPDATIPYVLVPDIMGQNFFGPEQWTQHSTNKNTKLIEDLTMAYFPWSKNCLESECPFSPHKISASHFAFLGKKYHQDGFLLNLSGLKNWLCTNAYRVCEIPNTDLSMSYLAVSDSVCNPGWYLMPKLPGPITLVQKGSVETAYRRLREKVPGYHLPSAIELATSLVLRATCLSEPLPLCNFVCNDPGPDGSNVIISVTSKNTDRYELLVTTERKLSFGPPERLNLPLHFALKRDLPSFYSDKWHQLPK